MGWLIGSNFKKYLHDLIANSKLHSQRRLLVIAGERDWGRELYEGLTVEDHYQQTLYISDADFGENKSIGFSTHY